jgi:hypothetical protein
VTRRQAHQILVMKIDRRRLTLSYTCINMSYMPREPLSGTMTIRLPAQSLRLLRRRAKARHTTTSEVVRDIFARELGAPTPVPSAW